MKTKHSSKSQYGSQRFTPVLWILLASIVIGAILVPVLLSMDSSIFSSYNLKKYKEGELCEEDVYSPASFEFLDEKKTEKALENAQKGVLPIFSYSLNATLKATQRMNQFINAWQNNTPDEASRIVGELLEKEELKDTKQIVERYASLSYSDRRQLLLASRETMQNILDKGLYAQEDLEAVRSQGYDSFTLQSDGNTSQNTTLKIDDMATKENLEKHMTSWFETYTVSFHGYQLVLLEDTLLLLVTENVRYDRNTTLLEREKAKRSTPSIYFSVAKGEKILEKDKVITSSQIAILEEAGKHRISFSVHELIGWTIYSLLVTSCAVLVFLMFIPNLNRRYQYLHFALVAVLMSQIATYWILRYANLFPFDLGDTVIPYLWAPLFVSQVSDRKRYGVVVAFLLSCYAILLPGATIMTFFICLTNASICVFFFQHAQRKVQNIYHWFYACITCIFMELCLSMVNDLPFSSLVPLIGVLSCNITLSAAISSLLVAVVESLFNLPTESRLEELSRVHSPILNKLEMAAPGTYNHSVAVSELAFEGANAIGANAMLARVGGLYHDIGKIDYPEYFVENQGEENKQDYLKPGLSSAIIRSHVKTGAEKGRNEGLPEEVIDIISQHHGNGPIVYFLNKAQEEASKKGFSVDPNDFKYDAPLPNTKEGAIVMICDGVEAASRTVDQPTPNKFERLIQSIVMSRINDGQLNESHLTLTELELIKITIGKYLVAKNHHRIEYPKSGEGEEKDVQDDANE